MARAEVARAEACRAAALADVAYYNSKTYNDLRRINKEINAGWQIGIVFSGWARRIGANWVLTRGPRGGRIAYKIRRPR